MAKQEAEISEAELYEIVRLLRAGQMTIPEIARRTGYSRAVVAAIKRRLDRTISVKPRRNLD
jgi:hypothetical protein